MHNDEIDNFHQMINESCLKMNSVKELHSIVNEFFYRDYEGISPKLKKRFENKSKLRC